MVGHQVVGGPSGGGPSRWWAIQSELTRNGRIRAAQGTESIAAHRPAGTTCLAADSKFAAEVTLWSPRFCGIA